MDTTHTWITTRETGSVITAELELTGFGGGLNERRYELRRNEPFKGYKILKRNGIEKSVATIWITLANREDELTELEWTEISEKELSESSEGKWKKL